MIVKLNYPVAWNTSDTGLASNFLQQLPGNRNRWEEYEFYINDDTDICDYWIVYGDLDHNTRIKCRKASIFIISEETVNKKLDTRFLKQFDIVIGSQESIEHPNYISAQYVCPWQIKRSYDDLISMPPPVKQSDLSAVISDMTWKEGHKKRFAFVNQLKGHFKSKLDWFGRGNVFINDKWDGLAPYRFSIAIENTVTKNYWSEKIMDCFLTYTMPVYSGCSNIAEFFPEGSYLSADLNDLEKTIEIIENAIASDLYTKNLPMIIEARKRILDQFQFFPKVCSLIKQVQPLSFKVRNITLKPESFYTKEPLLKKIIRVSWQAISKNKL